MELILKYNDYCINNKLIDNEMYCIKTINEILVKFSFRLFSSGINYYYYYYIMYRIKNNISKTTSI